MTRKKGLTLLELTIGMFLIGGAAVIYLQSMQSSRQKNEFYSEHFIASIMAAKVVEACFQETEINPYGVEALGLADSDGKPFKFSTLVTDGQTAFFKQPEIKKETTPFLYNMFQKDFLLNITTDNSSTRHFTLNTTFNWKANTGPGTFNYLCRFPGYAAKKDVQTTYAFPESKLEKKVVERIFEEKNKNLGTIVSSPATREVAMATGRIYFTCVGMMNAPQFKSALTAAEAFKDAGHLPGSAKYAEGTQYYFSIARDILDVLVFLQPHIETINKDIETTSSLNLRNRSRLELYIYNSTMGLEEIKKLFLVCVHEAASRYNAMLKAANDNRNQRALIQRCFDMHRLMFVAREFADGAFTSGDAKTIIQSEYYEFISDIEKFFANKDQTILRLAAQEKKFAQNNQLNKRYYACELVYKLFSTLATLKSKLPEIDPGTLDPKTNVIGKPMGDGTRSGALTWAKDQMQNGTGEGVNANNGKKVKDDIQAWNNWCLAFVSTAWGRKVNELMEMSAITSYENFKKAGKIKTDKKPPAGAIMYTGPTSGNPHGHIFLASGKVDSNNDPIIITTGGPGLDGVTEMPLSKLLIYNGSAYLGWTLPADAN
ncbi:MAG TPA: type II secretion system protein [Candidatus Rifleibacterium sp.]|nr:type II secretion system protein [Candidatus Rifleibacterium sp.]HPT44541.1 type II secretion system protein [Candidatus Rifleibacterium sp.]